MLLLYVLKGRLNPYSSHIPKGQWLPELVYLQVRVFALEELYQDIASSATDSYNAGSNLITLSSLSRIRKREPMLYANGSKSSPHLLDVAICYGRQHKGQRNQ